MNLSIPSPAALDLTAETVCTTVLQPSQIRWASRWDTYLLMTDDQIHWFSIINSLMIVLFLSGMVAMIMMRTLHRDISNYNQLETVEEAQEETGWKLVSFVVSQQCCPIAQTRYMVSRVQLCDCVVRHWVTCQSSVP